MTKIGKRLSLLTLAVCSVLLAVGQENTGVQILAFVDSNQVQVGDPLRLTVQVSSKKSVQVSEPRLPNIKGFQLLGSHVSSSSQSTFSGGKFEVEVTKNFIYQLSPTEIGRLNIGKIEVVVNGTTLKTKPIQIDVSKGNIARKKNNRPQPKQGARNFGNNQADPFSSMEDVFSALLNRRPRPGYKSQPFNTKESFFIQVEVDKTSAFVGEQVTVKWYLYARAQIRDIDTLKYPTLKGFWKEDIEVATRLTFVNEVVNGLVYQKALLASYALFPLKEGVAVVDPYKAVCTVADPRGFGFGRSYKRKKGSKAVKIKVKALPLAGKPKDFAGAVGQFQISAKLDASEVPLNQPVTLKVRVAGRGNAKLIDLPDMGFPDSIEVYDTKKESKFFKDGRSYVDFEILIIPRQKGDIEVPKLSMSFFDPEKNIYYQRVSSPLKLKVLPAKQGEKIDSSPLANGSGKNQTELLVKEALPQPILDMSSQLNLSFRQKIYIWVGILFGSIIFLVWRIISEFGWGARTKNLNEILSRRMAGVHARQVAGDWRGVGVELTNTVYFLLGAMIGSGGASEEIDKLIQKLPPSVRRETGEELKKTMSKLEILTFAPESVVGSLKETVPLAELVKTTEKLLKQSIQLALGQEGES